MPFHLTSASLPSVAPVAAGERRRSAHWQRDVRGPIEGHRQPDRRIFLGTVGWSLLAAPIVVEAQSAARVPRIGVMAPGSPPPESSPSIMAFAEGLRSLGWVPGQNIAVEYRWTEGREDRHPDLARDLVGLGVDLIVAGTSSAARAARRVTTTIPIVMASVPSPVESGLITSLARPGGNVTGIATLTAALVGKRLELLKAVAPRASRIAVLYDRRGTRTHVDRTLKDAEGAAQPLGIQLHSRGLSDAGELEETFRVLRTESVQGFTHIPSPFFRIHAREMADVALKHRLPAIYGDAGGFVEAGGLMFYGESIPDNWRRSARYVDRILKGAKPADLPVEQPAKFELVINRASRES